MHASPKSASLPPRYPSRAGFTKLHTPLHLHRADLHLDWTVQIRLPRTTLELCSLIWDLYMTYIRDVDEDVGHGDIDDDETRLGFWE